MKSSSNARTAARPAAVPRAAKGDDLTSPLLRIAQHLPVMPSQDIGIRCPGQQMQQCIHQCIIDAGSD